MASTAAIDQAKQQQMALALLRLVEHGGSTTASIERLLEAGTDVNGHHHHDYRPLMVAACSGNVSAVLLLIGKGADVDARALRDAIDDDGVLKMFKGSRALHCAIIYGELDVVRVLIREGADLNARDSRGHTPLMATCLGRHVPQTVGVQMARELLQAGADASLSSKTDGVALHFAVAEGNMDLVDMLVLKAPQTLNTVSLRRGTPLFTAADIGLENVVSQLLAAGAQQPNLRSPTGTSMFVEMVKCPLVTAIFRNHARVVQVLLDRGIPAIGGWRIFSTVLCSVAGSKMPRFLQMLLNVEGEERQAFWANTAPTGGPLLHYAASFGIPAAVSVLLTAGADETVPGFGGKLPGEMIGRPVVSHSLRSFYADVDSVTSAAILRMLERAPAFRAVSWLYPMETVNSGTDDRVRAAKPLLRTRKAALVVRIFRPQRDIFFVRRIGRYVDKNQRTAKASPP